MILNELSWTKTKTQRYKGWKTERLKYEKTERQKGEGARRGKEVGVTHHNFWSIVLNDLWSKKICRPKMIVCSLVLLSSQMILLTLFWCQWLQMSLNFEVSFLRKIDPFWPCPWPVTRVRKAWSDLYERRCFEIENCWRTDKNDKIS